jgi:hypothetical protein
MAELGAAQQRLLEAEDRLGELTRRLQASCGINGGGLGERGGGLLAHRRLGFDRIVTSHTELPNMIVNLVQNG